MRGTMFIVLSEFLGRLWRIMAYGDTCNVSLCVTIMPFMPPLAAELPYRDG
ncbi:MAG: hypothetical protein M1115_05780 [Actinobacteria bacterium]|nr:hypothetical protein [Actinomycetota bacterium]